MTDEAGNQKFVIRAFKSEREAFDKQLRQEMSDLLGPSVGMMLWKPYLANVLASSGLEEREIWLEEVADSKLQLFEKQSDSLAKSIPSTHFLQYRYGHLFKPEH